MPSQTLLKISLTISILGILLLLFLSNIIEPKLTNIKNIGTLGLNKKVQLKGQITSLKSYKNQDFQIITLKDKTGKISVIINKPNRKLSLSEEQEITVIGRITEYKNEFQVQAEKIIEFK